MQIGLKTLCQELMNLSSMKYASNKRKVFGKVRQYRDMLFSTHSTLVFNYVTTVVMSERSVTFISVSVRGHAVSYQASFTSLRLLVSFPSPTDVRPLLPLDLITALHWHYALSGFWLSICLKLSAIQQN